MIANASGAAGTNATAAAGTATGRSSARSSPAWSYAGTPTRFPHGHPWLYFGLIWALAGAWIALRWRDLLGPKPWLALWLILVALAAPNRAGMTEQHQNAAAWISGAIAIAALAFAAIRDWSTAARGVVFGVSVLAWITAAVCGVGVVLSQTGLSDDGSYHLGPWEAPAGGINDLIALLIGAAGAGVGWTAWRAGRWIAQPRPKPRLGRREGAQEHQANSLIDERPRRSLGAADSK